MHVATCQIELGLDGVRSLKEKRRILKSIISRLKNEFNIAIAEIDRNDVWQSAVIGVAAVGNDAGLLHAVMENVVAWIERKGDVYVAQYGIEFR
ncbi:MAG: DUF503 domain-containing protein [Chloroflexota bacterium]